jgi:hypothetical protein
MTCASNWTLTIDRGRRTWLDVLVDTPFGDLVFAHGVEGDRRRADALLSGLTRRHACLLFVGPMIRTR